ncbi:NAD(P)H-dependent oxidoreductase [Bdellovibrio sp. 22V]|uniref:NADPH-dependent FMN reductase n=1 Tax=Bdellovibrio TaxID=958 RepID=UPI0025439604|nr:NAD(P)H-dependent oxidoreductase [Bdellovibrio sp. 22V]WII70824.1 NAD(P)H-dependent oxidoreductase [Bdellovibrio sp. 22V]
MKVFLFAPSLRHGSYNKKLIRIAADIVRGIPHTEVALHEFNEFPMPMYDGDLEENQGVPEGVLKLAKKFEEADAVIISSPEYNGSIPGTFKNAIDWLSRLDPVPVRRKQICLIGASPGRLAAVRGNLHSRVTFHILGSFVWPDYFGVAGADQAFDDNDQFKDPKQVDRLKAVLVEFLQYASRRETPFDRLNEFLEEQKHQPSSR